MRKSISLGFIAVALAVGNAQATLLRFQEDVWNGTVSDPLYDVQDVYTFRHPNDSPIGVNDGSLQIRQLSSGMIMSDFRFDLTAAAQTGREVMNATLTLRVNGIDGQPAGNTGTHYVYALPALNTSWLETTANGTNQTAGIPWYLANGSGATDFAPNDTAANYFAAISGILIGTKTFAATPAVGDLVVYNLDATVVNQWLSNPAGYAGFAIVQPGGDTLYRLFFDSSEAAIASSHPLLELTMVPEPSTALLFSLGGLLLWRARRRQESRRRIAAVE